MNILLTDIVLATKHFDDTSFSWHSVPWIYTQLPWQIRMLVRWSIGTPWWKDKYILPIITARAEPHLKRFATGQWRQHEEEKLRLLFAFFQPRKELFSSEIALFLSGVAPSFTAEREKVPQTSPKGYGSFAWYRDELFSHYQERLLSVTQKVSRPSPAPRKEVPQAKDLVTAATKSRAEKTLAACNSLHDAIQPAVQKIEQLIKAAFPLRLEAEEEIATLQELQRAGWELTSQIDAALSSIPEYISNETPITETFLRTLLDDAESLLPPIKAQLDETEGQLTHLTSSIERVRGTIQKQLQALSRSIDKLNLLPQSSRLRPQQMQLIKSAREMVKKFRTALTKGPGPGISLATLAQKTNHLLELATSFYDEGIEIESTQDGVRALLRDLENRLSTEKDSSRMQQLQSLITELQEFLETVEVSSDREVRLNALRDKMLHLVEMKEPI